MAHSDYAESQAGLGIGLTLARKLVTRHDGTIEVRSEGIGRGSDLVVRIPLSVNASHRLNIDGRRTDRQQT